MLTIIMLNKIVGLVRERGRKLVDWVLRHHTEVLIVLFLLFALLFLWSRTQKPKPIEIVVPQEQIDSIERENEAKVRSILDEVDRKRQEDDTKVANAAKSPTPRKKNVTAEELERIVNGKK
jgi:hypothetical protein